MLLNRLHLNWKKKLCTGSPFRKVVHPGAVRAFGGLRLVVFVNAESSARPQFPGIPRELSVMSLRRGPMNSFGGGAMWDKYKDSMLFQANNNTKTKRR